VEGLDRIIEESPGAVVLLFAAMIAASKMMSAFVLWFSKRTVNEMSVKLVDHSTRIRDLETNHTAELRVIGQRLGAIEQGIVRVEGKVEAHNDEAEKWKQTIVGHGVRIEKLEDGGRS